MLRMMTRRSRSARIKIAAATVAGVLLLAACGGGDSTDSGAAADGLPADGLPAVADDVALDPAADVATNLLPDLVVDNLNDDNKVNLRNYGVGDKPILLWMWAPH